MLSRASPERSFTVNAFHIFCALYALVFVCGALACQGRR
jgi:hypothetical protein